VGCKLYGGTQQLVQVLCTGHNLAIIFLALPGTRENLGVSIYEGRANRKRQGTLKIGNWKDDKWPPK
jgi:hypothetical protein